ncbi:MAG: hypothetical protein QM640_01760 [Niabella sp.]
MKKIILLPLLILFCDTLNAQSKYDTINFNQITINGQFLYTQFNAIKKNIDDTKTKARVYSGKDISIPFKTFDAADILYTVSSKNLVFSYNENKPQDIFINYIKPNKYLKAKLKISNNKCLCLNQTLSVLILKKWFKYSYASYSKNKKDFRLVVKHGSQYAYCDLVFYNQQFAEMYLLTDINLNREHK